MFCASLQDDSKKEDKRKPTEPFKIQKLTQGMGLYAIGPVSPDRRSIILIAKKPDRAPNLYVMDLGNFSIRPPLTSLQWGAADPQWSADGQAIVFAGFGETASFSDLYLLELTTGTLKQLTANNFSDKEPVFSPDGKRVLFTTDESPLPDAAFGILHVASVPARGGKSEFFTEEDTSSIQPQIAADGKSVLLVRVDENSGRHSLWQYGFDGKAQRDVTGRRFARIRRYVQNPTAGTIVMWAQEQAEQQDDVYILDLKTGEARQLPDDDLIKRSPAVSPSGALTAFIGPAAIGNHLFLFDSSTGQIQQLTYKGFNTNSPVFLSNEKILFGSNRDGEELNELYLLDLTVPSEEAKKKDEEKKKAAKKK